MRSILASLPFPSQDFQPLTYTIFVHCPGIDSRQEHTKAHHRPGTRSRTRQQENTRHQHKDNRHQQAVPHRQQEAPIHQSQPARPRSQQLRIRQTPRRYTHHYRRGVLKSCPMCQGPRTNSASHTYPPTISDLLAPAASAPSLAALPSPPTATAGLADAPPQPAQSHHQPQQATVAEVAVPSGADSASPYADTSHHT